MNLNPEIQKRIFDAADQLHQDSGRADFPTVDAVRRRARTNMNDASTAMKAWRALQTATASTPVASIPDAIQRLSQDGLSAIWSAAQEHANASLRSAQAGWDAERAEAETVRAQLSAAFDEQAAELATLQRAHANLTAELDICKRAASDDAVKLDASVAENSVLRAKVAASEILIDEMHNRVGDLRSDLDQAHQTGARLQQELDEARKLAHADMVGIKAELAAAKATLKSAAEHAKQTHLEKEQALQSLTDAREIAAQLRGKVDALGEQNADLLARLTSK